jgi:hypothetical protein
VKYAVATESASDGSVIIVIVTIIISVVRLVLTVTVTDIAIGRLTLFRAGDEAITATRDPAIDETEVVIVLVAVIALLSALDAAISALRGWGLLDLALVGTAITG